MVRGRCLNKCNKWAMLYLEAKASCRRPKNWKNMKKMKVYENENLQKHIILVNLGLREYQNRIQHVHKSAHAKYELCSCQERPPGAKIQEQLVAANPRSHAIFQIFCSISCFWMFNWWPFADLINSKDCTHEYNILNFSDLKKVDKTFFKNTKYQSEKKQKNTFF